MFNFSCADFVESSNAGGGSIATRVGVSHVMEGCWMS